MNQIVPVNINPYETPASEVHWRTRKLRLCEAQNWRCCYCGHEVELYYGFVEKPNAATKEHVQSKKHGGSDSDENLVIACYQCNVLRDLSDPYHFHAVVVELFKNPDIKAKWHHLTPEQLKLLRQEIRYGLFERQIQTNGASTRDLLRYAMMRENRCRQLLNP